MKSLDVSRIKLSNLDNRRELKLPEKLTPELAEDIGIMVGDGHICKSVGSDYEIGIDGHIVTDRLYIKNHVKKLKKSLFGLDFVYSETLSINTCKIRCRSKNLVNFYNHVIGLPLGSKHDINVPKIIMNANVKIKRAFLRGLVDTDMTLVFKKMGKDVLHYPVIKMGTSSKNLVLDAKKALENIGFGPAVCCDLDGYQNKLKKTYTTHQLYLHGKKNLEKWINDIGFNNPKNILRYNLWKKQGYSLPSDQIEKIMSGPEGIRTHGHPVFCHRE